MDISFSSFYHRQKQSREHKLRDPVGDEAYRVIMGIAFRNEEDRYKSDANVRIYLKFDKVTEDGMTIGEEEMWNDYYASLISDNWDKLQDFIKEKEKANKENYENGVQGQTIKKPKRKAEFSKFTPVTKIPLANDPTKCIVLYVKDKELGETQEEQETMIQRVSEHLNGNFHKFLCRDILKQFT